MLPQPYYELIDGELATYGKSIRMVKEGPNQHALYVTIAGSYQFDHWCTQAEINIQPTSTRDNLPTFVYLHPNAGVKNGNNKRPIPSTASTSPTKLILSTNLKDDISPEQLRLNHLVRSFALTSEELGKMEKLLQQLVAERTKSETTNEQLPSVKVN